MSSLLTPEQFAQVNTALDNVTDTFMNTPITVQYNIYYTENEVGISGAGMAVWLTFVVNGLVKSDKSSSVDTDDYGRAGKTVRCYTFASKDFIAALQAAVTAYNTANPSAIQAPVPVITNGMPANYMDAARIQVQETPYGTMPALKAYPYAVWGPKGSSQHKLIKIETQEAPYIGL